jgi:hypothetical protein
MGPTCRPSYKNRDIPIRKRTRTCSLLLESATIPLDHAPTDTDVGLSTVEEYQAAMARRRGRGPRCGLGGDRNKTTSILIFLDIFKK